MLTVYQCDDCGAVTSEPGDDCADCVIGEMFEVYELSCNGPGGCGAVWQVTELSEDNVNWDNLQIECPTCNEPLGGI